MLAEDATIFCVENNNMAMNKSTNGNYHVININRWHRRRRHSFLPLYV